MTNTSLQQPHRAPLASLFLGGLLLLVQPLFAGSAAIAFAQSCNPAIAIEAPGAEGVVSGQTTIAGWALDQDSSEGSGVSAVRAYYGAPADEGGVGLGTAATGIDRPEVDAAYDRSATSPGWSLDADFRAVPEGPQSLYVYALTRCGWMYVAQDIVVERAAASAGPTAAQVNVDQPAAGVQVSSGQPLVIQGWTADADGPGLGVDMIRAFLDGPSGTGTAMGIPSLGLPRPDVAEATGNPDWGNSGFRVDWSVAGVSSGAHTLYVGARSSADGEWAYTTVPITVMDSTAGATAGGSSAAAVSIEAPSQGATVAGTTTIRGSAADCVSGTAATRVRVYNGDPSSGTLLGDAMMGASNRDLAGVCSGKTGTGPIGFSFTLDPATLPPGQQALTVAADTPNGTGTATLNVTINTGTVGGSPGSSPLGQGYANPNQNPNAYNPYGTNQNPNAYNPYGTNQNQNTYNQYGNQNPNTYNQYGNQNQNTYNPYGTNQNAYNQYGNQYGSNFYDPYSSQNQNAYNPNTYNQNYNYNNQYNQGYSNYGSTGYNPPAQYIPYGGTSQPYPYGNQPYYGNAYPYNNNNTYGNTYPYNTSYYGNYGNTYGTYPYNNAGYYGNSYPSNTSYYGNYGNYGNTYGAYPYNNAGYYGNSYPYNNAGYYGNSYPYNAGYGSSPGYGYPGYGY